VSIALVEAALDTVTPGLTGLVLDTILLINSQVAVRIWYGAMAFITLYLT